MFENIISLTKTRWSFYGLTQGHDTVKNTTSSDSSTGDASFTRYQFSGGSPYIRDDFSKKNERRRIFCICSFDPQIGGKLVLKVGGVLIFLGFARGPPSTSSLAEYVIKVYKYPRALKYFSKCSKVL